MKALYLKDIHALFASPLAYLFIGSFITINSVLLWVFNSPWNIFQLGVAELTPFFKLAPWVFLLLIPALCMQHFNNVDRHASLSAWSSLPITNVQLISSKFLSTYTIIFLALLSSTLFTIPLFWFSKDPIAIGLLVSGYIHLICITLVFNALSIWASALFKNVVSAFLFGLVFCGIALYVVDAFAIIFQSEEIKTFSFISLLEEGASGVLSFRTILFTLGWITLALLSVWQRLKLKKRPTKSNLNKTLLKSTPFIFAFTFWIIATGITARIDFTTNARYTLTSVTKNICNYITEPITVTLLMGGDLPLEFYKLKQEALLTLQNFKTESKHIVIKTVDPFHPKNEALLEQALQLGAQIAQSTIKQGGQQKQTRFMPWALCSYQGKDALIPLLQNELGATQEARIFNSVQQLEYRFAEGILKLARTKTKKIAVLKGNKQLEDAALISLLSSLSEMYYLAPFTLDSVANAPLKTLEQLNTFDLILNIGPTEAFTEKEKWVLDQYTMQGGHSAWFIESTQMLEQPNSEPMVIPLDLNLTDMFFKYGLRIPSKLVQDINAAPIRLAYGSGANTSYQTYPWVFSPLATTSSHPISAGIAAPKLHYANPIDTLSNKVRKKVILKTSEFASTLPTPLQINTNTQIDAVLNIMENGPNPQIFKEKYTPLAVLLEGKMPSMYQNRIAPVTTHNQKYNRITSLPAKMLVVGDADMVKNQFQDGKPLPLGFDKWTQTQFGNNDFLLNAFNYLLEDNTLINIRTKPIELAFLNPNIKVQERLLWQFINTLAIIPLLLILALLNAYWRKRKYR